MELTAGQPQQFQQLPSGVKHQTHSNGSLLIRWTERSDQGDFLCQASNAIGPGLSKLVRLRVHRESIFFFFLDFPVTSKRFPSVDCAVARHCLVCRLAGRQSCPVFFCSLFAAIVLLAQGVCRAGTQPRLGLAESLSPVAQLLIAHLICLLTYRRLRPLCSWSNAVSVDAFANHPEPAQWLLPSTGWPQNS